MIDQETRDHAIKLVQAGDPRFFIENLLVVASKQNQLVPFHLNRLQDYVYRETTGRDYYLKYRQGGSSIYQLARLFAFTACTPFFNAAVITLSTDHGRTKERLFKHVERFVESMPPEFPVSVGHKRVDYFEFDETDSQMFIGTVGSREFGRGETFNALMVTELGSFTSTEADNVLTSAVESVVPGGILVFETTPKLMGSHAHGLYMDC